MTIAKTGSGDVTINKTSLTFTTGNWNTAQTVTVVAAHDDPEDADEDRAVLKHTFAGGDYQGLGPVEIDVTVDDDEPAVTVSFSGDEFEVAENDQDTSDMATDPAGIQITVTLSENPGRIVPIQIVATPDSGTGASGADYTVTSTSLSFGVNETEKTITVLAVNDTIDDDDEKFVLSFKTPLPTKVTGGDNETAEITILDDDHPVLTAKYTPATMTVPEGDDPDTTEVTENRVIITMTLSAAPEREVKIPTKIVYSGGATSADHSMFPPDITFGATDTAKTVDVTIVDDTIDDDGETVSFTFADSGLPERVTPLASSKQSVITITDDDDPHVKVSYKNASQDVDEGATATVTVLLDVDPERKLIINLTDVPGGGGTSADYSLSGRSVSFQAGQKEKTVTFTATQDTLDDDDEFVTMGFGSSLPDRVTLASTKATTKLNIVDDDDPHVKVQFENAAHTVAESDNDDTNDTEEHKATIKVKLSAAPERAVTIPITKTNDGASNSDYSLSTTNVAFGAADTEKTIIFTAAHDDVNESTEKVRLGFGSSLPTRITKGATDETTVSITDDDTPGITISPTTLTVAEGGSKTYTVVLDSEPTGDVTVAVTRTGSADVSVEQRQPRVRDRRLGYRPERHGQSGRGRRCRRRRGHHQPHGIGLRHSHQRQQRGRDGHGQRARRGRHLREGRLQRGRAGRRGHRGHRGAQGGHQGQAGQGPRPAGGGGPARDRGGGRRRRRLLSPPGRRPTSVTFQDRGRDREELHLHRPNTDDTEDDGHGEKVKISLREICRPHRSLQPTRESDDADTADVKENEVVIKARATAAVHHHDQRNGGGRHRGEDRLREDQRRGRGRPPGWSRSPRRSWR